MNQYRDCAEVRLKELKAFLVEKNLLEQGLDQEKVMSEIKGLSGVAEVSNSSIAFGGTAQAIDVEYEEITATLIRYNPEEAFALSEDVDLWINERFIDKIKIVLP